MAQQQQLDDYGNPIDPEATPIPTAGAPPAPPTPFDGSGFVNGLAQKYGIGVGQGDIEALNGKNPEDRAGFQTALETQYQQRAAPKAGAATAAPGQSGASAWNGSAPAQAAAPTTPDWYQQYVQTMAQQAAAAQTEQKAKGDALYGQLDARAKQSLAVTPNDPAIKGQVDAFRTEQERARRNDISDVAEQSGPYANIRGEQRMAAERVGQNTSGFQAGLMSQELASRRQEITSALSGQAGLLTAEQSQALQQQLAALDQVIKTTTLGQQAGQFNASLAQDWSGKLLQNDQFLKSLGLQAEDRSAYWSAVNSGLLG